MPKDANGEVILETVDLCGTWAVSMATRPERRCGRGRGHQPGGQKTWGLAPSIVCPQTGG